MSEKQLVVVGDIHGCLEEFDELLKKIQYNKEQVRLVLLGDLMDRGPDPVGCVRRAREMKLECVMGNHEEKHLRWHKHEKKRLETGKANPMRHFAPEAAAANEALNDQDWTYLKNLPVKIDLGLGWFAVHAGCEPRYTLEKQDPKQIMRVRYVNQQGVAQALTHDLSQPEGTVYWDQLWKGPESIIYGHCVHDLKEVRQTVKDGVSCVGIDTGCCFGGHLTAAFMRVATTLSDDEAANSSEYFLEYVQVKAKKNYYKGYGDE
jgi:hypothetical protein